MLGRGAGGQGARGVSKQGRARTETLCSAMKRVYCSRSTSDKEDQLTTREERKTGPADAIQAK